MEIKNKTLEKVKELVYPQYSKIINWPHGWPHILGVKEATIDLAKMENQDPTICGIAAYCHDLGRVIEEEMNKMKRVLVNKNHAKLSVKPTKEILEKIGVNNLERDLILEAVEVHSDFKYFGNNMVAKIVRDSDKKEGLGPWAVLRTANFIFSYNFQPPQRDNVFEISRKALDLLGIIHKNPKDRKKYLECLSFNLEWYEDLLNTESAKILLKPDYQYTKSVQKYMLQD